jgi:hypothetical protein
MLLREGHCHRHPGFTEARPLGTLGAKAAFAPEYARPNRPLRRVVRQLHALMAHERRQRLPSLQHFPIGPFSLGHPTRLARVRPPLHLAPNRPHRAGKTRMAEGAIADPMPPVAHLARLRPPPLSNVTGPSTALEHRFEVPPQMRPAELASPAEIPGIRTPTIGDQPAPTALPQDLPGHLTTARPPPDKDGDRSRDRRPQPGVVLSLTPARFVQGCGWLLLDSAPGFPPRAPPKPAWSRAPGSQWSPR